MKILIKTSLILLLACNVLSQTTGKPTLPTTPKTEPTTVTTTEVTTHSTEEPTTTTTTTTEAPSTTKPTPEPTTTTTSTASPPSTTTLVPTSTSPAPQPTSTPAPTPGSWSVNTTNNTVCIHLDLIAALHITYENSDNKSIEVVIDIPKSAKSNGSCDDEHLTLTFTDKNGTEFNVTWFFALNKEVFSVSNLTVDFNLSPKTFPDAKSSGKPVTAMLKEEVDYLKADKGHSLKCVADKKVSLNDDVTKGIELKIDDIQFQAYMDSPNGKFGDEENCVSSKGRDIVPIAVGCALVGLVVIVLVAYLIGRRRSRQAGYQSV